MSRAVVVPTGAVVTPWTMLLLSAASLGATGPTAAPPTERTAPDTIPADTVPADTYLDAAAHRLVERAREARESAFRGMTSYEARVWERAYAGLSGSRFRRERALWVMERSALVRWEADGSRIVRWEGAFQAQPVAGRRSDEDPAMARDLVRSLSSMTGGGSPIFYRPNDDRIVFGAGQWVRDPLASTGPQHYRYGSGDTLRLTLPSEDRVLVLAEVRVTPRRSDFRLVAGSLWFDEGSAELVRAAYRPARPFNLGTDTEESDMPRFLRSVEAEIRQVTVDYGLHHLQWWLPHRFALELEVRAGRFVRLPFTMEWSMTDYRVNEAPTADMELGTLPKGWTREDRMVPDPRSDEAEPDSVRLVSLVPPADSLHLAPTVAGAAVRGGTPGGGPGFDDQELEAFRRRLDRLVPRSAATAPSLAWGLQDGLLRYNRVEGVSVGAAGRLPLGRTLAGRLELRVPTAVWMPLAELRLVRGPEGRRESLGMYRRLSHTSDWTDPLGFASSVSGLVAGADRGQYYRAQGIDLTVERHVRGGRTDLRLFVESHRAVERNTNFHLTGLVTGDTLRSNLTADHGTWYGGSLGLAGHRGIDPERLRLFGTARAEAATGPDGWGQRLWLSAGVALPLGWVETGVEAGAGRGWGELPVQRHFFLGGPGTVRGVRPASLVGESFWFGRFEVARPQPAFRLAAFGDLGWAGPWDDFGSERPVQAVGMGISILEGILRLDVARAFNAGQHRWWIHAYLDGLL